MRFIPEHLKDHAIQTMGRMFLMCIFMPLGAPAMGEPQLLPDAEQGDWNAVGRVNVAGLRTRGMCTGTLVAPDLVLTAAHCLHRANGSPVRPEDAHFVAGWRRGAFVAHSTVSEIQLHPDYNPALPPLASRTPTDIAFMLLSDPISTDMVAPLPIAALPDAARETVLIGYRQDRPHAPSRQTECNVLRRTSGAIGLSCPVINGASGGPVLWSGPKGWRIVGLISAAVTGSGATRSLAARIPVEIIPKPPSH